MAANRRQYAFRFRSDIGTGASVGVTPTWHAAENTNISLAPDTLFRLPFFIWNDGDTNTTSRTWQLYYSHNGGAYTAITTSSSVVIAADASSSLDEQTIGSPGHLTAPPASTYQTGRYDETGVTSTLNLVLAQHTQFEFGLQIVGADVADGDTIDFRVYFDNTPLQVYDNTPRVTVAVPPAGANPAMFFPFFGGGL